MAESKIILSKRSLRRHVKRGADAALAALHASGPTYFNLAAGADTLDTPPSVPAYTEIENDDESGDGDWVMASEESASSGEDDWEFNDLSSSSSGSDSEEGGSFQRDLRHELKEWAITTNTPISHISSLLSVLRKHFPDSKLPKDGRTLLSTPTYAEIVPKAGGNMHYFGVAKGILGRMQEQDLAKNQTLKLQINVDGLPLFKSSSQQFWPILALIEEDPIRSPFLIGLYCGYSKPTDASEYLSDFVAEMGKLASDGLEYQSKKIQIEISCFVCDAPARAFLKNIKAHNSYYGCERCMQEGSWANRRLNYSETDAVLRTDDSFATKVNQEHHKEGDSPLQHLDVGLVTQFVLDFMHLVCLGVMRKLIWLWQRGPLPTRIGSQSICIISENLIKLGKRLPKEFGRKGRSLREVDRWKATEFRTFLLYTGPIALKKNLPKHMYQHFLLLHVAITILCSPRLHHRYCDYAENLLVVFVQNFHAIYGDFLVYNVHSLIHLASDVRKYGPLPQISAFPFENFLYKLKKLIRKPNQTLQQIVKRLTEKSSINPVCPSSHNQSSPSTTQYATDRFTLSTKDGNNTVSCGGATFKIEAISRTLGGTSFVARQYLDQRPFFNHPVDSTALGTAVVGNLAEETTSIAVKDIDFKMVTLEYKNKVVAVPLNHN
jgi:hypothetical protein